ncbi:MAG: phenylalanine--tRNA ligase beta subunit-related protein, partial [Vulcanimicrobiaceae bacterium]
SVGAGTREILLESASFSGPRVRRTATALGAHTEASARHRRGLPPGLSSLAAARAAWLFVQSGARAEAPFALGDVPAAPRVLVPGASFAQVLGVAIAREDAQRALRALGFEAVPADDGLTVVAPPWREDVQIPEDVVEEVGRIVGYDAIPPELPAILPQDVPSAAYRRERLIAHALAALGYREAISLALESRDPQARFARAQIALAGEPVELSNPLSEEQRFLRFSLLPRLLEVVARARIDDGALRLFEIGHTFADPHDRAPFESAEAAWLLALPRAEEPAWLDRGFLTFKGESTALLRALCGSEATAVSTTLPGLHPGKTASLVLGGRDVATIGALDPRLLAVYEIEANLYAGRIRLADLPAPVLPRYRRPSRFPAIVRDLALVLGPEIPALDVEHAVRAGGDGRVAEVRVFDEFRGPQVGAGKKSLAVRVVLQRPDATLTDADADAAIAAILAALRERCGAELRT